MQFPLYKYCTELKMLSEYRLDIKTVLSSHEKRQPNARSFVHSHFRRCLDSMRKMDHLFFFFDLDSVDLVSTCTSLHPHNRVLGRDGSETYLQLSSSFSALLFLSSLHCRNITVSTCSRSSSSGTQRSRIHVFIPFNYPKGTRGLAFASQRKSTPPSPKQPPKKHPM